MIEPHGSLVVAAFKREYAAVNFKQILGCRARGQQGSKSGSLSGGQACQDRLLLGGGIKDRSVGQHGNRVGFVSFETLKRCEVERLPGAKGSPDGTAKLLAVRGRLDPLEGS